MAYYGAYRDSLYSREGYGTGYSGYSARDYSYPPPRAGGYERGRPPAGDGGLPSNTLYNPEYYDKESGYGYEGTVASAIDAGEDPMSKRRKIQNVTICVDFIRGFCSKGTRCPKPHVDYVESGDDREILAKLKFCHDFQNRGMCTRSDCKFLHVTRREEDEFLLTGTIPQSVFIRMREWATNNPEFNAEDHDGGSFSGGSHYGGRSQMAGRKRSFSASRSERGSPSSFRGRGFKGNAKHSTSQPVTFGLYCIDFLKGTCVKGGTCTLKHVESVDDLKDREGIIQQVFCHDFQNGFCKRAFCKFIHASRQEEAFFEENGFFPPSMNARNRDKLFFSNICLDSLRNQCLRGASCHYQHVDKVEQMSERICISRSIFCHDHQEGGCTRPNCKMIHASNADEHYFLQTGSLPERLRGSSVSQSALASLGTSLKMNASNVCREFVKNMCTRGNSCRFYHPTPAELEILLAQQNQANPPLPQMQPGTVSYPTSGSTDAMKKLEDENKTLLTENQALKTRNQQLERLLADACYCMTLAVGDQNPAIAALMKTIAEMAPASSLANQPGEETTQTEGKEQAAVVGTTAPPQGSTSSQGELSSAPQRLPM